jgi:integrase
MITRREDGKWICDIQPAGRGGKRFTRIFKTKTDATQFEVWAKGQTQKDPLWKPEKRDARPLTKLIELWFEGHGRTLKDGESRKRILINAAKEMKDPAAEHFTAAEFTKWRSERKDLKANTANHVHAYLRAVFNFLSTTGEWKRANPLHKLPQLKTQKEDLRYLTEQEIREFIAQCEESRNPHCPLCSKLALATGARWNEVEQIKIGQIGHEAIRLSTSKDGTGKKWRSVPITPALESEIRQHHKTYKDVTGLRIFGNCYSAAREAIERANIGLPDGQLVHVLRHTFASFFLKGGGDLPTLQKLLGHKEITQTMVYAHLHPGALDQARILNPIAVVFGSKPQEPN